MSAGDVVVTADIGAGRRVGVTIVCPSGSTASADAAAKETGAFMWAGASMRRASRAAGSRGEPAAAGVGRADILNL